MKGERSLDMRFFVATDPYTGYPVAGKDTAGL
jgi:hypothetical protein